MLPSILQEERLAMRNSKIIPLLLGLFVATFVLTCSKNATSGEAVGTHKDQGPLSLLASEENRLDELVPDALEGWQGDFNAMTKRRLIRALVIPNKTAYFFDGVDQKGTGFEALKLLEEQINKDLKTGSLAIHMLIIPTTRDRILSDLINGHGDIAASNLTITPERLENVDFADPFLTTNEVVVTGAKAPPISSLEDLAGQEIYIRRTSSYWESLERLNQELEEKGLKPARLRAVDEILETEDILEMVNAGLIPITVADDYLANLWAEIFENVTAHPDLILRSGGEIAWAMRPNSPELTAVLNRFVKGHKKGTLKGNIVLNRYLKDAKYVRNSLAATEMKRFEQAMKFFQKYAGDYDFDWLMIAAQGYQESRLDQGVRSKAGAIGVMQILKSTASDPNVGIPDIDKLEPNIQAGTKYLRFLVDHYFDEPDIDPINRHLFGFAAYNAGPNRIQRLRKKAAEKGLDPNVWFRNVEVVVAHDVGREPVTYVSNIYKYYLAYRLMIDQQQRRDAAKS
jgi:membrane-bound lytic murein transglycosylase MltF